MPRAIHPSKAHTVDDVVWAFLKSLPTETTLDVILGEKLSHLRKADPLTFTVESGEPWSGRKAMTPVELATALASDLRYRFIITTPEMTR